MTMHSQKIALVTGGSRGLGKDMALRLAERGFDLILTYRSRASDAAETVQAIVSKGRKAHALSLDVADSSGFGKFAETVRSLLKTEFGSTGLQALVNNAGVGLHVPYSETTEAGFDSMVDIHLKAPFFLTQKLLPLLQDGAAIVNISSGLARFSYDGYSAYGSMKAAVDTLTRYQAKELAARRIRVNSVAPGAIETDFGGGAVRDNSELNANIAGITALGRVGLPDDIGSVVAFLCSEDAKWINGQRLEVSGGIYV